MHRERALNGVPRRRRCASLVATDIAARGIDVDGISARHQLRPDRTWPESYVHRIGRTARNGATGIALTLCDPSEASKLRAVERVIRQRLPVVADHLAEPDPQAEPGVTTRHVDRPADHRDTRSEKRPQHRPAAQKPGGGDFKARGRNRRPARQKRPAARAA
jgi:ATP-dependent RNA helicase RhlE